MAPAQLDLFGAPEEELDFHSERALAERLPDHVLFGTSSWTFPGWGGLVYAGRPTERDLLKNGLERYARYPLFRTVGIDRSYYRPLDARSLRAYADQLPPGFRCVSKVWSGITTPASAGGQVNEAFLEPTVFVRDVLEPLREHFADHAGPVVFEFPPSTGTWLGPEPFVARLEAFLGAIPRGPEYAVELRNRELLGARYLECLARHGVGHVLNFWEDMPDIGAQLSVPGVLTAPFVVARLLIPPGRRYADRKCELSPFDRLVDPQDAMRDDVARLVEQTARLGKVLFVVVNNKAEGSSPLTVRALAERVARKHAGESPEAL